jgi:hypothetical protein
MSKNENTIINNINQHPRIVYKTHLPEYKIWKCIKTRCYNKNMIAFHRYGGRGITMCESWKNSFESFYTDMGSRPSKNHSIDRIDNNGNYEPSNCKWSTKKEQGRNKIDTIFIEYDGKKLCMSEWAELTGISKFTLRQRLKKGWDVQDALTKPSYKK